jgi:predicted KAP-like P-loop ATPase
MVPGLSKSARRLASALAQTVPILKGYSELYPAPTQRDDIENMKAALARLPKRIVVLLDEIDRMEKEELLTLLKVVRGVSSLPNLSFVCAAERQTLITTAKGEVNDENNRYFEKFFPASIQIPNIDQEALRKAGIERLTTAFRRLDWFNNESEAESYRKQIDDLWTERIAPFCRTLRAIGLLANDVGTAAALLRREVYPVDLTLVELLRRFKPSVYDLIGRNSEVLTGGESWTKGGAYRSDKEKEAWGKRLAAEIRKLAGGDEEAETVERILHDLFPKFDAIVGKFRFADNRTGGEEEKRIAHPGMFAAYFRYELPDAMFSSVELEEFLRRIKTASTADERKRHFLKSLIRCKRETRREQTF